MVWMFIGKIVSEIAPVLCAVSFNRCVIDLCIKKRYMKKSFCFGFNLVVVAFTAVF